MKKKKLQPSYNIFCQEIVLILFLLLTPFKFNAQNFFDNPESVAYDTLNNRYLISNVGSGDIVQMHFGVDTSFFYTGLTRTLGMVIVNNILFVTDFSGVVGFDLTTDELLFTIPINGMNVLNDITADTSGYLYVTDSGNGNIYRIRINDHTYSTIVSGIYWPNGILYDVVTDRIIFCAFGNHVPIRAINRITLAVTTVITTNLTDLDGMTTDLEGTMYISSFTGNSIYRFDNLFTNPPELISSGHNNPADIFYNKINNTLVVPNFNGNTIDFVQITPLYEKDYKKLQPQDFTLYQNYPNPFNPSTIIEYILTKPSSVSLKIFDIAGRNIQTLVNGYMAAGKHNISWNSKDYINNNVSTGVYFYQLKCNSFSKTKMMILLK